MGHGDQWEITVPSLLGIDQDDPNAIDPKKVDPKKLLRMDAKDVVQKAQQEMQHLKRHFLVVVPAPALAVQHATARAVLYDDDPAAHPQQAVVLPRELRAGPRRGRLLYGWLRHV